MTHLCFMIVCRVYRYPRTSTMQLRQQLRQGPLLARQPSVCSSFLFTYLLLSHPLHSHIPFTPPPTHTFSHFVVHNTLVSSSSHSYFLAARPSASATTDCSYRSTSLCPSVTQQTSSPCLPAVQVTTATAPPLKCATSARSRRTARALVRELTGVNTSTIATLASFRFFSYQERSVTK